MEPQRRFVELRYDGDRRLSGTLMRYGSVGQPYGKRSKVRERFEAGAFGDVSRAEVVLNAYHDKTSLLARNDGGGMEISDGPVALTMQATLPKVRAADDALELVRGRVLRGLSIEFSPKREPDMEDGVMVWPRDSVELTGVGVVAKPAYRESKVYPREKTGMDKDEIRKMVDEALEKHRAEKDFDPAKFAEDMEKRFEAAIEAADEKRKTAEAETREAEERAKAAQDEIEARVAALDLCADLLPKDFKRSEATVKEIYVAAVGDEVDDAADQDEGYLRAKVEGIIERRDNAGEGRNRPAPKGAKNGSPLPRPFNVLDMRGAK